MIDKEYAIDALKNSALIEEREYRVSKAAFLRGVAELLESTLVPKNSIEFSSGELAIIEDYQKAVDAVSLKAAILNAVCLALDHVDDTESD